MNYLFNGQMEYESEESLNNFLQNININEAVEMLEISLDLAVKNGTFNLQEVAVILLSLKTVKNGLPVQ